MGKVTIKLNSAGVRSMLRSAELLALCRERAEAICARCGDGYAVDTYTGTNRVNAMVYADTYQAKADNSANNTILKALR